jgi:hypothetical protein
VVECATSALFSVELMADCKILIVGCNHGDFKKNRVVCDMPALYLDFQVGQRLHQLFVKQADSVPALIVFAPRLIIVLRGIAEGAENAFKIMLVLKSRYEPILGLLE